MAPDEGRAQLVERLEAVAAGDRSALKDVYDRTAAKLFGIALRILKDREEAEDVLQDVFITVWMKAGDFDPKRASPITWLSTIARNRSIDRLRQLGRRSESDLGDAYAIVDETPDAFAALDAKQGGERLSVCLDELDIRTRDAIATAFFGGLTYEALAHRASVPLGTMKSVIRRGLIKLKECLSQ